MLDRDWPPHRHAHRGAICTGASDAGGFRSSLAFDEAAERFLAALDVLVRVSRDLIH